jgi:hypothetical protein
MLLFSHRIHIAFTPTDDQQPRCDVDVARMGRYGRSWKIVKASFSMLKLDRQLLVLPLASMVCMGLSSAAFLFGTWQVHPLVGNRNAGDPYATERIGMTLTPVTSALLFIGLVLVTFTGMFFNAAMIIGANTRLFGNRPTLADCLKGAAKHGVSLMFWALISVTVSLLLKQLAQRFGLVGKLIVRFVGVAWTVATFLTLPAIVVGDLSPKSALQRSTDLSKRTWGEQLIGNAMVSMIIGPIMIVLAVASAFSALFIGWYSLALLVITGATVGMMASNIYSTCLYNYATTGEIPAGFDRDTVVSAFTPKG